MVREMRIVHLGRGWSARRGSSPRPPSSARSPPWTSCAALITERRCGQGAFVATSATRDAGDRDVFVAGIRSPAGRGS
ncbi:hypothetical protein QJS66_08535 [Kocuria rhizophila]|nr:hypothetical protein QJS66_08535 [Kocuria rhizophila]